MLKTGRFSTWRFPSSAFYFPSSRSCSLNRKTICREGQRNTCCRVWTGNQERDPSGKWPPTGKSRLELPSLLLPLPGRRSLGWEEEAPGLRTQPNVTAFARISGETPDVTRRGWRCWPAVTRRALSQSALGACAGRPLNSARQLPAVWRVHSAMQYVCQRCGTKEQPFCDWAGPAPRCQGLTELLSALSTEMPFILAPENQNGKGGEKKRFWYFRFQFALFAVFSKLPIRKNYQCHKMAAT